MDQSEVPDAWPPEGEGSLEPQGPVVPMFPLPGVFLFPNQLLPLHVFEPRYRQMVEDSLDGPGRLVIATVLEEQAPGDRPPEVLGVAGIGEIARHDRLPDGRFLIFVYGLGRVNVTEEPSDQPYRRVRAQPLSEIPPSESAAERLCGPLLDAVRERAETPGGLPDEVPLDVAADLLSARLDVPQPVMEEIFGERDVERRAELALRAHARFK